VRGWGHGGEMTQAFYSHMNNKKIKIKNIIIKKKKRLGISEKKKEKQAYTAELKRHLYMLGNTI
jgi:hypothetical protein